MTSQALSRQPRRTPMWAQSGRFVDTATAMEIAGVSRQTIVNWCVRYRLGERVAGSWRIERAKLQEVLRGMEVVAAE